MLSRARNHGGGIARFEQRNEENRHSPHRKKTESPIFVVLLSENYVFILKCFAYRICKTIITKSVKLQTTRLV
jgi:hypothetical protein